MTKATFDDALICETAYHFWSDAGQPKARDEEQWLHAVDALNTPVFKAKPTREAAAKRRISSPASKKTTMQETKAKAVAN